MERVVMVLVEDEWFWMGTVAFLLRSYGRNFCLQHNAHAAAMGYSGSTSDHGLREILINVESRWRHLHQGDPMQCSCSKLLSNV